MINHMAVDTLEVSGTHFCKDADKVTIIEKRINQWPSGPGGSYISCTETNCPIIKCKLNNSNSALGYRNNIFK